MQADKIFLPYTKNCCFLEEKTTNKHKKMVLYLAGIGKDSGSTGTQSSKK
jgi:hypothetical protein